MPQKTNTSPMMPSTTPASQAFNLSCIDCTMLPPFHTPRRGQIWLARCLKEMAEWTGLEPATPGVTGRYSNQLNYHSKLPTCVELWSVRHGVIFESMAPGFL